MKKKKDSKKPAAKVAGVAAFKQKTAQKTAATVLHIDDDANDTQLFEAAVRKAQAEFVLHTVTDGEQAMAYLNGRGVYADRTRYRIPSLILLDLKMPRATGFEVLKWIRSHPLFGSVPVVVLSGSELKDDMNAAYAVGANSYKVKPLGFAELVKLVQDLNKCWLHSHSSSAAAAQHFSETQKGV